MKTKTISPDVRSAVFRLVGYEPDDISEKELVMEMGLDQRSKLTDEVARKFLEREMGTIAAALASASDAEELEKLARWLSQASDLALALAAVAPWGAPLA